MIIPKEITYSIKDPRTKAAFISEFAKIRPGDCDNCGGAGVVVAFIATEGPYDAPAGPYLLRKNSMGKEVRLTSKAEEIGGRIRWWVGQTISVACPICQSEMAPKGNPVVQQSTFNRIGGLTDRLTSPAERQERARRLLVGTRV